MSFDRVPSKSEVMGWNPHQLSDYMRRVSHFQVNFAPFVDSSQPVKAFLNSLSYNIIFKAVSQCPY